MCISLLFFEVSEKMHVSNINLQTKRHNVNNINLTSIAEFEFMKPLQYNILRPSNLETDGNN